MSASTPHSLKWRLVRWLMMIEIAAITLLIAITVGLLWATGYLIDDYEQGNIDVLRDAIARDAQGNLVITETQELAQLREEAGEIWFIVRDNEGHQLSEGAVPQAFAFVAAGLDRMSEGRFGQSPATETRPQAVVSWVDSPAGNIQIFTGTEGQLTLHRLLLGTSGALLFIFVPMQLLLALATIVATPIVVRRMLAGLSHAAAHAAHIEFDQQGVQMPIKGVPAEFLPLVEAFNNALKRLDEGYARHKRFLAQAAHELRTPIAILNTRVATLPPSDGKARLIEDTNRLATLAGQLLDLQRLGKHSNPFCPLDLGALSERVIVDLAPLAFAAGYEMCFDAADGPMIVLGDHSSLERALTNLVQNAIEHGGRRGKITFRVMAPARVEICDEGDGVPPEERERIFEPFSRLHSGGKGAGLGLSLVREIMRLHGGDVAIVDGISCGACFRIDLPPT